MDYIGSSPEDIKQMLDSLGLSTCEELFEDIPAELKKAKPLEDDGLAECELIEQLENISALNQKKLSFLGGGAYRHHIPSIVSTICQRAEFLTSYTPYQAEMSQGTLQAIFEFQSTVCALTGMQVANASTYDGACSCAEAVLMSLRIKKGRRKILMSATLHPHYQAVVKQYLKEHAVECVVIPFLADGTLDSKKLHENIDNNTAAILIQSPNFFGIMEDLVSINHVIHSHEALSVLCANPLSYGIYASAHELDCDIAVGDMQPLGIALQCGGPYAGYFATKQEFLHQLPGRIVSETKDSLGQRGYVLTLQAREQHIRREKATSNLCTNQGLATLASLIAASWYGKEGLPKLALTNFQRASYLKERLKPFVFSEAPIFNEFVVRTKRPLAKVLRKFAEEGMYAGIDLSVFYPELDHHLLIAVTELHTKEHLDHYANLAQNTF